MITDFFGNIVDWLEENVLPTDTSNALVLAMTIGFGISIAIAALTA